MAGDEEDGIEVLSSQYQPTPSVNAVDCRNGTTLPANGRTLASQGPRPMETDAGSQEVRPIRSVDDYERRGDPTYYFRSTPPAALNSANRAGRTSGTALIARNDGDTLLLPIAPAAHRGSTILAKEPLSNDEKRRKRISVAVGIIAGMIIVASVLLVAVTLNMTSKIDAIVKEQNDNLYDQLTSSRGDYGIAWKNSSSQSFPVLQYASRDN